MNKIAVINDCIRHEALASVQQVVAGLSFERQDMGRSGYFARERATTESPVIPALLWTAVAPHVQDLAPFFTDPETAPRLHRPINEWTAYGCNPLTRVYRYHPGADFTRHWDEPYSPSAGIRSVLTILLYLPTDECIGGETAFDDCVVEATPGRAVLFNHLIPHEGRMVEKGVKLTVRSDVMARLD